MIPLIFLVSHLNLLGITFQKNCLFSKHVDGLIAQCKSLLYLLKDLRLHCVRVQDMEKLFNAVILSRMRYGISVYGCDQRAISKVNQFLQKCHSKNFTSKMINIHELLKEEDQRLLQKILSNANHPLRAYLSHTKSRSIGHNFLGVKPRTETKLF